MYDRVRAINRLRATLLEYFPSLERAFDYSKSKAALILLSRYRTPEALRRVGAKRLFAWLKARGDKTASVWPNAPSALLMPRALSLEPSGSVHNSLPRCRAAEYKQSTVLGAERIGALLVAEVQGIDKALAALDQKITECFGTYQDARILLSMPGFGPILAAPFLARIGGSLARFESVDRLAGVAGLVPSIATRGENNRQLGPTSVEGFAPTPAHVAYRGEALAPVASPRCRASSPASRAFYDRKRAEGKSHKQALLALARRRLNITWAMLRDRTVYVKPPATALLRSA